MKITRRRTSKEFSRKTKRANGEIADEDCEWLKFFFSATIIDDGSLIFVVGNRHRIEPNFNTDYPPTIDEEKFVSLTCPTTVNRYW